VELARARWWRSVLLQQPVLVLSAVHFLVVLPLRPEMASWSNLELLILSAALLLTLAVGQTFVLVTGGIDLSMPAVMSLASVVGGLVMAAIEPTAGSGIAVILGVTSMLAVGLLVGLCQGLAVSVLKMPAFLVSLASLQLLGGLAVWCTQSGRIAMPAPFVEIWYGRLVGIPVPLWLVAVLAVAGHLVLSRTLTGMRLYAIGHNLAAAVISGVPTVRTTCFAYMASSFCAAAGAIFYSARLYTGSPQLLENEVLLDCIGAAVIGGVSLFGGKGHIPGVVLGALFIALVGNSLNMLGLRYWHVIMIKGGVILLAALLDAARMRWLSRAEK
jgi:ribose/xylose/arabinose/galactoside ABC-type transport system permease subunit